MDINTSDKWEVAVKECGKYCDEVTALSIIYTITCFISLLAELQQYIQGVS